MGKSGTLGVWPGGLAWCRVEAVVAEKRRSTFVCGAGSKASGYRCGVSGITVGIESGYGGRDGSA